MKHSVQILLTVLLFATINSQLSTVFAQGTAFTYQGRLNNNGAPANGSYDFSFALLNSGTGGLQLAGPVTNAAVFVTNGLFTTTMDFGNVFNGSSNWLQIDVSAHGANSFQALIPRQQLTPTPYAIYAANAATAATATSANAATTATSATTAGTATTATTANNFSGALAGDVTGTQGVTVVTKVGGVTAANVASGVNGANAATSANTANTIVKRDASGNFSAGTITASLAGNVGIGTTAPFTQLANTANSIYGTDSVGVGDQSIGWYSDDIGYVAGFYNGYNDSLADGVTIGVTGSGARILDLNVAGSSVMVVNGNGNVGIDTTTPDKLLDVAGAAAGVTNGSGSVESSLFLKVKNTQIGGTEKSPNVAGIAFGRDGKTQQAIVGGTYGNDFIDFYTGAQLTNARVRIDSAGNVGIGTTTPAENLTIAGVTNYNSGLKLTGSTTNGTGMALENTAAGGHKYDFVSGGASSAEGAGAFALYDETAKSIRLTVSTNGNVGIGTTAPDTALDVIGIIYASGNIYAGGNVYAGSVELTSDRNAKENFQVMNPATVLAKVASMPITEWNYKTDSHGVEHLGPMAQDFHAAFDLNGKDDKHISVIDEGGVALAAIQGLNEKLQEELNRQNVENAKLKRQNDSLAERLNELAVTVKQLAAQK